MSVAWSVAKLTGGVMPPREFVLMDRSAIGLGGVFLRLRAELNWSRMFHDLVGDFTEDALAEVADRVVALATAEDLPAHGQAVTARFGAAR